MEKEPKRRLFIALALPENVQNQIAAIQQNFPGAKWTAPSHQLHITLAFLGSAPQSELQDICVALSRIIDLPPDIHIRGVGFWGNRILWAGVEATPSLILLKEKIEEALGAIGCQYEKRDFKPHVTLARLDPQFKVAELNQFLTTNKLFEITPFVAKEFSLYESMPRETGSLYVPLIHFLQVNPFL